MRTSTRRPLLGLFAAAALAVSSLTTGTAFADAPAAPRQAAPDAAVADSTGAPITLAAWPAPTAQRPTGSTIAISGSVDGGNARYYGTGELGGDGQEEGQDPIFRLADGAALSNVIIGAPAADGIHCQGTCTLRNVWWEDVGEDAATARGTSTSHTMTIVGGGARHAADKVFQHNGAGTVVIRDFEVQDFATLYRSCGNCSTQRARHVIIDNVTVTAPGSRLAGINSNYGDTARLSRITIVGDSNRRVVPCQRYRGVTSGEPSPIGSGPDGTNCLYSASDITYR
ncbi:pectate lyase [Marinitenerispora sediminis]|uniref:Pectate lyase n=1 Tax=Marinitenerispora sediminis TaxID=1931232 RepID=A0A368T0E7_9ACTN|nr:pectate lyase [Marinitenerispora sediminis]RCV49821.1 pectate lyase [Marinitenerispora sediminis]RCV52607.1 pectate lyase [Marinitenerispora sediminis]RCV57301.1 pectate lyase [Marinitenerispora sediminis]